MDKVELRRCGASGPGRVWGENTPAFPQWFATQRHTLHSGNPEAVWGALRQVAAPPQSHSTRVALPTHQESLPYLETRRGMLDDAWYQARGYPIGRGSVERANTLVVERRLKGTGRHWARAHVHPMVALRTSTCSDRWQEAWRQVTQHSQQQGWQRRVHHQTARRPSSTSPPMHRLPPQQPVALPAKSRPAPRRAPSPPPPSAAPNRPSRPPPDHP